MKKIFIFVIKLYQRLISPFLGTNCRYFPSCSEYMVKSIENCGVIKGFGYGVWRILRCNPYSKGGVDHPPTCECKHVINQK